MSDLFIKHPLDDKCVAITTTTALGNLAYQVDNGEGVKDRRHLLSYALGLPIERFTYVHQHHSDIIMQVTTNEVGKGKDSFEDGLECDALYTYEKNVPLCIFHADCVPIFFINNKVNLVGIIHAGFKGTMKHVTYKSIKYVLEKERLDIKDFSFYIGPYREPISFEIDEDNKKIISEAGFIEAIKDNRFDNGLANIIDLRQLGVKDSQIKACHFDTVTDDRLFSAYQKTPVGRLVSLIYLK